MAKEKKRKTPNPYIRAVMWKVIDIITALLPILIFTIVQWDEYFGKSSEYAFKNILGLAMMILIVSLAVAKIEVSKFIRYIWFIYINVLSIATNN